MMNQEIKASWCAALRSGEYLQGIGRLEYKKDGKIYNCCLGVLCHVVDLKAIYPNSTFRGDGTAYFGNGAELTPSRDIMLKTGLSDGAVCILVRMNDCAKASFSKIADYIEQNL